MKSGYDLQHLLFLYTKAVLLLKDSHLHENDGGLSQSFRDNKRGMKTSSADSSQHKIAAFTSITRCFGIN